jgi:hypothetical protein
MSNEENIKAQITALEHMADVLINEVKSLSRSSLFRSGVDISAQKLRVKAQLMRDFHDPIKVKVWDQTRGKQRVVEPIIKK